MIVIEVTFINIYFFEHFCTCTVKQNLAISYKCLHHNLAY